jgi:hypothetical protein
MSVPAVVAFCKRFAVKFIEVVGAGIATAVSGYLLAHFTGYWSPRAGAPPVVQVAPNATVVAKNPRAPPKEPRALDASEQRLTEAPDTTPPAPQPARTPMKAATPAAAPRQPVTTQTSAAGSKASDWQSVEAEVRAALANADATRPAPPVMPARPADAPPAPSVVTEPPVLPARQAAIPSTPPVVMAPSAVPAPVENPVGAVGAVPRTDAAAPPPAQPASVAPEPLTPVEIKSRPVAAVEAPPPPGQKDARAQETDILSAIKKIPELFRSDPPAAADEAPRPPLPVGQ